MNKKAIIIDDEHHARAAVRGMIEENFNNIQVVGEAKDLPDGIKLIHSSLPDIVFLDIEMPGHSGLEILDFFPKESVSFHIIFVTAYNEYALNAFELSAIDYLIKPIQLEQMKRALSKIERISPKKLEVLSANLNEHQPKKIILSTSAGQVFVKLDDIIFIKADGSYSNIVLVNNERHYVTKKLVEYDRLQEIGPFLRIHRSQMINVNHIDKILKQDGGSVVMVDGTELSISKDKKAQLEEMITQHRF